MKRLPIFFRLQLYSLPAHDDLADVLHKTDAPAGASLGHDFCSGLCNRPYFTHNVLRRELTQRFLK